MSEKKDEVTPDTLLQDVAKAAEQPVSENLHQVVGEINLPESTQSSASSSTEENPVKKPVAKSKDIDFESLCDIRLRKERDGSFSLLKHGAPVLCPHQHERKLEYIDPKTQNELKKLQPDGLVLDSYQYITCTSKCRHFYIAKEDGVFICQCALEHEDAAYHIEESNFDIVTDLIKATTMPKAPSFKERMEAARKGQGMSKIT